MKKLFLIAAAVFVFVSVSSADPLAPSLNCPNNSCLVPAPVQTAFLGVPISLNTTSDISLAQATTLLASVPSPPAPSPLPSLDFASSPNDSLVANPLDPAFNSAVPSHGIGAAEPPTLLLLATGLLFVSFYRKHAATRRSRPPRFA